MALDFTNNGRMFDEVCEAESVRDTTLRGSAERVARFAGAAFGLSDTCEHDPKNHAAEFITLALPRIAQTRPRWHTGSDRPGDAQDASQAIGHAMNRWARDSDLPDVITLLATDFLFDWAVALVTRGENPAIKRRDSTPTPWPEVTRIDPHRFIIDPVSRFQGEARFMGHLVVEDLEDLLERAEAENKANTTGHGLWDLDAIRSLSPESGMDRLPDFDKRKVERGEVAYYEMWLPEHQESDEFGPDQGFHGSIITFAPNGGKTDGSTGSGSLLRKPNPYFGAASGPYQLIGCYPVKTSPFRASPLHLTESQVKSLNDEIRSANVSAANYARKLFYEKGDADAERAIKSPSELAVGVASLEKLKIQSVEMGGVTQQQLAQIEMKTRQLQDVSGIGDALSGNPKSGVTATGDAIADKTTDTRFAWIHDQFVGGIEAIGLKVASYFYYDDDIEFSLGEEGAQAFGMPRPFFTGGNPDPDSGESFEALGIKLDLMSMARQTEPLQQARALQFISLIPNLAVMARQFPEWDVRQILSLAGTVLGQSDAQGYYNAELAAQYAGIQPPPSDAGSQPRINSDVGTGIRAQVPALGNSTGALLGAGVSAA